jgi:copper chaperone
MGPSLYPEITSVICLTFQSWEGIEWYLVQQGENAMYEIRATGTKCGGCAGKIKRAIHATDSNAGIDVDIAHKTIRVSTQACLQLVLTAVKEAGCSSCDLI